MRTAEELLIAVNIELMTEMGLDISEYIITHKDKMDEEQLLMHDFTVRCINVARKEIIDEIMNNVNYYVECDDDWRHDVTPIISNIDKLKNNLI